MNVKNKSGITLIALIVTIVVLIIIAGISIATLTADNGVLRQTNLAKVENIEGTAREQVKLAVGAMRLAIAEAQSLDNSYKASVNKDKIREVLLKTIRDDTTALEKDSWSAANDTANSFKITYSGDDYKNACNDDNAEIVYTITLGQKSIEITNETNSTLKDQDGSDVTLDIGGSEKITLESGLYDANDVLLASWNELVNTYGMDITKDYDFDSYYSDLKCPCNVLSRNSNLTSGTKLIIDESVTSIGSMAFMETQLTNIEIPNSVESIGTYAFYYCINLKTIVIPENVTSIGKGILASCKSLENVIVSEGNTVYHSNNNCIIETESKKLLMASPNGIIPSDGSVTTIGDSTFNGFSNITSLEIPDVITSIGEWAFQNCTNLANVKMPESLINISKGAFTNCTSLTSIKIPDNVISIGDRAFNNTGLTSIEFNASIKSIGASAFSNSNKLTNVTIHATEPPTLGESAFPGQVTIITVPAGTEDTYKATAGWISYADKIVE